MQPRRRDPECMVYHIFMRTGCHIVARIEEIYWDEQLNNLLKTQNLSPEKIAITTKRARSFKKCILLEEPLVSNSRKGRERLNNQVPLFRTGLSRFLQVYSRPHFTGTDWDTFDPI